MSLNHQAVPLEQSAGCDPKSSKRNSGLFAFFKWFKPSTSRESINSDVHYSHSSSSDSLSSIQSAGTIASFSFVPPNAYPANNVAEKSIVPGPETDTYKARLKQRDKRRENDKNLTLRKKYNLFFNRETLLKNVIKQQEENTKSLPLMTKSVMEEEEERVGHRRTNSESSKIKKAGAYLHVKGKRKAPQPPGKSHSNPSTMSLKRKKRTAPLPPEKLVRHSDRAGTIEYADADIICNDSLKLDHGILKPAKDENNSNSASTSARSSYAETPVSPRPWYKRNTHNKDKKEKEHKYELPETQILRNSTLDLTLEEAKEVVKSADKKKEEKRKSGVSYLTNISELDREASEIIKKEQQKNGYDLQEIPEFMRPREESKINTDSWVSPKRRSARDLIAKFNAITNVTKVTVFGAKDSKKDYFGKQHSLDENKRQETMLETHKKRIEQIDKRNRDSDKFNVLMKSESASAIKTKPETPKLERKSWNCPKCNVENDYWRIICHVCSNIKPYFDDFYSNKQSDGKLNELKDSPLEVRTTITNESPERVLERSRTQIGFSALANYNAANKKKSPVNDKSEVEKKEEKEKLKKMLIEMKNSLPKRKSNILMKQNSRASIIIENPENIEAEVKETPPVKEESAAVPEKTQEQKVAEILIGTKQTIYENIKVKKTDNPKPIKVSSSAQTSSVVKKIVPPSTITNILQNEEAKRNNFELMRPKDFEDIYSDKNAKSAARIYANMAQSDELSLFFNVPKKINDLKNNFNQADLNTDTIEINRLLRRLETAIAKGDLTEAAIFAKELAQLKVNCSVVRQKGANCELKNKKPGFQIEMYVEDKISHRGPFPIQVTENQTVLELKQQIEREFEIPVDVQRWILGKELVTNDNVTLKEHNINSEGCPVFLYLVAPDMKTNADKRKSQVIQPDDKSSSSSKQDVIKISNASSKLPSSNNKDGNNSTSIGNDELKQETEKPKNDHTPKIVNVIPKIVDNTKTDVTVEQKLDKNEIPIVSNSINKKVEEIKNIKLETTITPKTMNVGSSATAISLGATSKNTDISKKDSNKTNSALFKVTEPKKIVDYKNIKIETTRSSIQEFGATSKNTDVIKRPAIPQNAISSFQANEIIKPKDAAKKQTNACTSTLIESAKQPETILPKSFESKVTNVRLTSNAPSSVIKEEIKHVVHKPDTVKSDLMIASVISHPPVLQHYNKVIEEKIEIKVEENKRERQPKNITVKEVRVNRNDQVAGASVDKLPKKATLEDDFDEYESKTLKPQKEWECHMCTFLNPVNTNICSICATARLKATPKKSVKTKKAPQPKDQTYLQLVNLDNADLVENVETFECMICFAEVRPKDGVTLRECLHQFCKTCLAHTIQYTEEAEVKCPYRDADYSCNIALQDREIKALVKPEVYDQFLAKSIAQAENKIDKSFHCKTPDCKGWCIFEDNVNEFRCPVCRRTNCLTCQAIHIGLNCKQYQERMNEESEIDEDAKRTKEMLEEMVDKGEALTCPTCKVVLMKKWGCDWLKCSMCKTEICWVTRGPRWGPGGKGDTSGGCQCGLNGVKCHPKCNYCH